MAGEGAVGEGQVFVIMLTLMNGGGDIIGSKAMPQTYSTLQACEDDLAARRAAFQKEFPVASQSYRSRCQEKGAPPPRY